MLRKTAGKLDLDDWDRLGHEVPCIVNLMPSGAFLMEEFCYAGGIPAVMKEIRSLLHESAVLPLPEETVAENIADAEGFDRSVIRTLAESAGKPGGIAVLRGKPCAGAVIKPSAASPELLRHRGRAVVFESIDDYKARIDSPNLEIDRSSIMGLKRCGPKGYPGMAEVSNMALPQKLLQQGVRDMVRISDARMSGTAFGTVVLHVARSPMSCRRLSRRLTPRTMFVGRSYGARAPTILFGAPA